MPAPPQENPLTNSEPWDAVAIGYEQASRPFLEKFSVRALELLEVKGALHENCRLLDLACGPGTTSLLCAEKLQSIDGVDFSKEMLAVFSAHLQTKNLGNVTLHHRDGQKLDPFDQQFDCVVSMFGLMFFPDRRRGMSEAHRVLVPGGTILISSWAPIARSSAMMAMFEGVRVLDPTRPVPQADMSSLENPEVLRNELIEAGFSEVEIHEVEESIDFESPDELWDNLEKGAVPLVILKKKMGEELFKEKSALAKAKMAESIGSRRRLSSTAYLAVGRKAD